MVTNRSQLCLPIIRTKLLSLTHQESRIAEYVTGNPDKVILQSISDLANSVGASEATIVRFCRKVGYSGFKHFRRALTEDLSQTNGDEGVQVDRAGPGLLARRVIGSCVENLNNALSLLNEQELNRAIEAIASAQKVELYGLAASGLIAMEAYIKLMRVGINCIACTDSIVQVMSSSILPDKSVVIAISHSGLTKTIIQAASCAKESGATVIAITSYDDTPLTKLADIVLLSATPSNVVRDDHVEARVVQHVIIDILVKGVISKNKEKSFKSLQSTTWAAMDSKLSEF